MTDDIKYKLIKSCARMHDVQRVRGCNKIKHTHTSTYMEKVKKTACPKTTHPFWKHHPPHPLGGVWQSLKAGLGV